MPRISEEELARLKHDIDLAALIRSKGIELKPHGKDLIGLCPFHDDKEPSLIVTPNRNLWNCLGACQTGGSTIDWIMKAEGVSFRHAVEILRNGDAATLVKTDKVIKQNTIPKLDSPVSLDADDQQVLHQVIDYYQDTLKRTPAAISYLKKRGIHHPQALETFRIGFADRTLGLRLPHKNRQEGAELRKRLQDLGIYRESGHEHFNGSVVFPIIDEQGRITEIYGRKIVQNLRKGTPYHTYLPGPHQGIWNPSALAAKEIILCESIIDALSFWCNGFRNVTAAYGVSGFIDEMLHAFIDKRVWCVYIAYDRDEAGDKAAEKLAKKLNAEGIEARRINFPRNMDANDYIRTTQPPEKALQVLINGAAWLGKRSNTTETTTVPDEFFSLAASLRQAQGGALAADEPPPPESLDNLPTDEPQPAKEKPQINVPCKVKGEDVEIRLGNRTYRIRGFFKNLAFDVMKINIRVFADERYYIDTLDLYNARHRTAFVNAAAEELESKADVVKRDLGRVMLKLEEMQEQHINDTTQPKKNEVRLSDDERKLALELLKAPDLLGRIRLDVEACGIVGEKLNALTGYLAAVSRKLERPLGIIVQSSSAAGKSSLMDAILAFMPPEERIKYSAMTVQSLFYMGETDLKQKILAIVEEEGAERASYALKLLQSEGELSIASTGKDPTSGRMLTHEYRVEGPVMIFLTTTAITIDEELQNRCIVLTIDEGREQTAAIHRIQRELMTLEGLVASERKKQVLKLHRNAQRLLRPLKVVNPYAPKLTFLDDRTRTRRDHMKYLTLINSIALLHQYQRTIHHRGSLHYIEATVDDITVANELAHEVLGRSLDELPPQSRRLLMMLDSMVKEACTALDMHRNDYRFTRRDVRRHTNWSDFQVRIHLDRLASLEYVLVHRGGRGQSFVYELLYDGKVTDGRPFLLGLIDEKQLKKQQLNKKKNGKEYQYDRKFEGQINNYEVPSSPQSAPIEGAVCV